MNRSHWLNKITLSVIFSGALLLAATTLMVQVTETVLSVFIKDIATKVVKLRRGTSQGLSDNRLNYAHGKPVKYWSVATDENVMALFLDYRKAYWKPWPYVHGYIFF